MKMKPKLRMPQRDDGYTIEIGPLNIQSKDGTADIIVEKQCLPLSEVHRLSSYVDATASCHAHAQSDKQGRQPSHH